MIAFIKRHHGIFICQYLTVQQSKEMRKEK